MAPQNNSMRTRALRYNTGVLLSCALMIGCGSVSAAEPAAGIDTALPINEKIAERTADGGKSVWSLPMNGPMGAAGKLVQTAKKVLLKPAQPEKLETGITVADVHDAVSTRIDELLDAALDRDDKSQTLEKAVAHYRTTTQKVIAETKDATDYLIPYRGFGPSSEAGDIILDEKVKLKSRASAEYARQKHIDETHVKVVASMMQLAMGLGTSNKAESERIVESGMSALTGLVGEEEAAKTKELLQSWVTGVNVPDHVYKQPVWDVALRRDKLKSVIETSMDSDPIVKEIIRRLHKYNQHSKFMQVSAHVVQATLGAASLTPSFIGPAAKTALLAFVMATGGPEQCKLLKELYLDKRFESRWKVINEEAHMALENYQIGVLTKNPVLMACSESIVQQMVGEETVPQVLGTSILPREVVR
jgi:hypothetical protein